MKPSNFSVWIMTLALIGLSIACSEGWQGCPGGTYPEDGVCKTGCPSGTINQNGKCVPFTSNGPVVVTDGDDDTIDGDTIDGDTVDADGEGELEVEDGGPDTSNLGLNWVSIPGGTFEMGCSEGSNYCELSEKPRHTVAINAFKMLQTEVTYDLFAAFVNEHGNDCEDRVCFSEKYDVGPHGGLVLSDGVYSAMPGFETYPMAYTPWVVARAICEWIGGRLPTEAEWEYAARARTSTEFICGVDKNCIPAYAWDGATSNYGTKEVGTLLPNAFGLYDVFGNASELTQDCWHENFDGAPTNGEAWEEDGCSNHVTRGGSCMYLMKDLRSSNRGYGGSPVGFRCAY